MPPVTKELPVTQNILLEIESAGKNKRMIPYECAKVESVASANSESIYFLENRGLLLKQMKEIIRVEAPVSKSYLLRKTLKLWNTARAGAKLNAYLTEIVENIPTVLKNETHQVFYWNEALAPDTLHCYRDNSVERRGIEDISQEEIMMVISEIIEANLSLSTDDLVRTTAKALGFLKVGSQIDQIISAAIQRLSDRGKVSVNSSRVIVI